jgi:transcriptional regulator with XRE-family HTH domain
MSTDTAAREGEQMTAMKDSRPRRNKASSDGVTATTRTSRRRQVRDDGYIDEVAVERSLRGETIALTRKEAAEVTRRRGVSALQHLIANRMKELGERDQGRPLTYRQLAGRTKDRRGKELVSRATIGNILNGKTIRLTDETVEALAKALEVDEKLIRDAIHSSLAVKFQLPARVQQLSPEGWQALLDFADFQLAQENKPPKRR